MSVLGIGEFHFKFLHGTFAPPKSLSNDRNNILISNNMTQANPLRHMSRASTPHKRVLERLSQRAMDLVADFLDGRFVAHDQGFAEVRFDAFAAVGLERDMRREWRGGERNGPFSIYPHQLQFQPAPLDDVLDAEVELAAHDDGVGFAREFVEEVEADAVDFVVDV